MTYNIGGRTKDSALSRVTKVVNQVSPDILVIQEATELQDADGARHRAIDQIVQATDSGYHTYFGHTISLLEDMHVQQAQFVHGVFHDWHDWRKGNAVLSRWEFARLSDGSKPGVPRNIPLYQTPVYQGSRDTEPRHALLARVNRPPVFPFIVGVHLTTLVAEREHENGPAPISQKTEEAHILRLKQARRVLELLKEHVLERGEVVFLLGDFNAVASESCIASVLETEGGFVRLTPTRGPNGTHTNVVGPIDHIFVFPRSRLAEYECYIVDSAAAYEASDHLPVVADVKVR